MNLRILDYEDVLNEIKIITKNGFVKMSSVKCLCDNIEIPYYTYGNGDNHIVVCGGTHGSEIISVDFVLRVMSMISKREGLFKNLDIDKFTFHFIPVLNPEGYIVSTSAIRTVIKKETKEEDIEKICKEYFLKYREDDINAKDKPLNRDVKLHQLMFMNVNYECISEKYPNLRNKIKQIYENKEIPYGSMVIYRATGDGIETNRSLLSSILNDTEEYGKLRYNNLKRNIPGPLGMAPLKENIIENKFLKNILESLYNKGLYTGFITYHATGGMIYSHLSNDDEILIDEEFTNEYRENKYRFNVINYMLARTYQQNTKYQNKKGYQIVSKGSLKDFDEYLRLLFPATLLIELSYMGGNPLGPYGDKENNYIPTMESNLKAFYYYINECVLLKDLMYGKYQIIDREVSEEYLRLTRN